ncbi:hypothetical protein [Streptomyces caniscabiei]|uniref:Uncharacterized protein n=1 Tax=Streptomyces caniscabiei TaxID=2746961 RepID=A0ABU4N113_9ACTN|nr:hypothetical protein [Streptomyces caniscabiei]MBE4740516.1 hypothetical protein [Streptomyces caniscabiei]MBE4761327.1 hypothetical protein [Streptomyces caniscabiei]MBE4773478.1 hypothetical protein [Streptomyces caniscabiei]MBE4790075.1 hypothetical protein [Streptomyces caniscabiei]MBE4799337.1 hypothetical protein [Streptomyces caniscabiei]
MTELSTEPVAVQPVPATPPPPPDTPPTPAPVVKEVEHTPGGWPIVPLALSGANSTVGTVAAASLVGGPVAAMVAATGMVVLGAVAAARSRTPNPRRQARRAAARAAGRSTARSAGLRSNGTGTRGAGGRSAGTRAGGSGGRSGKAPGQHRRTTGPAAGHASTATGGKTRSKPGNGPAKRVAGGAGKAAGKAGQVKALRAAQKAAAGSRAGQRAQTTTARRAVADARRNAKATAGKAGSGKRAGLAGRLMGGPARKARAARDTAIAKSRAQRDAKTGAIVKAQRAAVRKAPARKAARRALRRSAARFQGRRLLAALLALPVGLLGCLTTPIGRKFGIAWLMHPGRRLYRRMVDTAAEQAAERDENTRKTLREEEATADAEATEDGTGGIADQVERPTANVPTPATSQVSEGENVSGFRFEEAAEEMEQAANSYDPENAMEILAMVEGLPAALTSVANVMKILAERSDSEFPLEKEVADGFNDIFGAVMSAVAVAEDMGPLFRQAHEQDIARHEDPRNGPEAEKGWNV